MSWSTGQKKGILSTIVLWANGFGIGDSERLDKTLQNNASGSQGPDALLRGYAIYPGILFPWEQFYIFFWTFGERIGHFIFLSAYMCSMEIIQIPHGLFVFYDCIQAAESLLCRSQHYCVGIYLHPDAFLCRSIEESGYELPVSYVIHQALREYRFYSKSSIKGTLLKKLAKSLNKVCNNGGNEDIYIKPICR